jgi:hypothetical protein
MLYKLTGKGIFPDAAFCRILSHRDDQHFSQRRGFERRIMPFIDKVGRCAAAHKAHQTTERRGYNRFP